MDACAVCFSIIVDQNVLNSSVVPPPVIMVVHVPLIFAIKPSCFSNKLWHPWTCKAVAILETEEMHSPVSDGMKEQAVIFYVLVTQTHVADFGACNLKFQNSLLELSQQTTILFVELFDTANNYFKLPQSIPPRFVISDAHHQLPILLVALFIR